MNFFKREPKKVSAPKNERAKSLQDIFAPIPVADVSESTWNDWEDSIAFQNSQEDQLQEAADSGNANAPDTQPSDDPFASITRKHR
jgi:hypothetical protein